MGYQWKLKEINKKTASKSIHFLVLCTLSVQLTLNEKKDDVIRRLAEMVTKAQLQDNEFLDNLVKTVKHGDLNVTTKVLT